MKYVRSEKQFNLLMVSGVEYDKECYYFYNHCYSLYKDPDDTKYITKCNEAEQKRLKVIEEKAKELKVIEAEAKLDAEIERLYNLSSKYAKKLEEEELFSRRPPITVTKFSMTPKVGCYEKFREYMMEIKPMRHDYSVINGRVPFNKLEDIKVGYCYDISEKGKAMLVGTAFDYLARIIISKYAKKKFKLKDTIGYRWFQDQINYHSRINGELLGQVDILMDDLELNIESYMSSEKDIFLDNMLEEICILSRLEGAYRGGIYDLEGYEERLLMKYDNVIDDLKNLSKHFIEDFIEVLNINENTSVVLNPTFGSGYSGFKADGDVIIDGCLIDFKVSKNYKYEGKEACQISTYYMLNEFNKHNGNIKTTFDISSIALYSVRYGKILKYNISEMVSLEKRDKIIQSLIF